MTIIEVRDALRKEDPNELFNLHHAWVSTLIPFWRQAVIRIAELTDTPQGQALESHRAIHDPNVCLAIQADNLHKGKTQRN